MKLRFFLALLASLWMGGLVEGADALAAPRLLFLGNSITLHGPSKEIGWAGNWGMAASAAEKDFVHLVVAGVGTRGKVAPEFKAVNVADLERNYESYDAAVKLKEEVAFAAGTVVVAIGENAPTLQTEAARGKFRDSVVRLVKLVQRDGQTKVYVRSCFWPDAAKDAALKEACTATGAVWVDISALAKDEGNFARSERKIEHAGVAGHPGDKGMRAIAEAILAAMK